MKQLIIIWWGEAFENEDQFYKFLEKKEYNPFKIRKKWKTWIAEELRNEFQIIEIDMPNKVNAKYKAWKIWFEKLLPYLNNEGSVLVWSSLGGLFLAKYLSENIFPVKIEQLHFVAPLFNNEWLIDEYVDDFELNLNKIHLINKKSKNIRFYFSKDDPVLPFKQHQNYKYYLPELEYNIFENKWHFWQSTFPELLNNIKNA